MQTIESIKLNLRLQDGWSLSYAEVIAPVALITLVKNQVGARRVRIDLDKQIFIDAPPSGLPRESAVVASEEVVKSLQGIRGQSDKTSYQG